MGWPCFWLEPTGEAEVGLRRYTAGRGGITCADGYHSAMVWLGERTPVAVVDGEHGRRQWDYTLGDLHPHDDPRWPAACSSCGQTFDPADQDDDQWQRWVEPLYRRSDTGELRILHPTIGADTDPPVRWAEPGAMWHNFWLPEPMLNPDRPRDGLVLEVRCPYMDGRPGGQDWCVDRPATRDGGFWTRTGDPREPASLTVSPSIAIGSASDPGYYHGFLQSGVLTDHLS